jgi:hypothetical protein
MSSYDTDDGIKLRNTLSKTCTFLIYILSIYELKALATVILLLIYAGVDEGMAEVTLLPTVLQIYIIAFTLS